MSEIDWASLKKNADDATKPAPEGRYRLFCDKAEAKTASTGSPMIVAKFHIEGGPLHGKNIFHNFVLTVDNAFALSIFFRGLGAFGIDDNFFAQLSSSSLEPVAAAIVGRQADADLGIRPYQGQDRNEIKGFHAVAGMGGAVPPVGGNPVPSMVPAGVPSSPAPTVSSGPPMPSMTPAVAATATVPAPSPVREEAF